MSHQIENKQDNIDPISSICNVDVKQGLSILESRVDKWIENKEEYYKYTQFCENIFNIPDNQIETENHVKNIEDNNKNIVNIFDQYLLNS